MKYSMQGRPQPVVETKLLDLADKLNPKFIDRYAILRWLCGHEIEVDKFLESRYLEPEDRIYNAAKIYNIEYPLNMVMGYLLVKDYMRRNREKFDYIINKILEDAYVSMLVGRKGGGKTALCAELSNELHKLKPDMPIYWLESNLRLPSWISSATRLEEVETGAFVVADEASITANARAAMTEYNKSMSQVLAIARHQDLRILFCSQHTKIADVNIYRFSDCWFIKQMQMTEMVDMQKARQSVFFNYMRLMQPTKISQTLFTDGNEWMLFESGLPEWWSDEVSKGWGKLTYEQAMQLIKREYVNSDEIDTKMLKLRLKTRGVNLSEEEIEEIGMDGLGEYNDDRKNNGKK